MSDEGFKDVVDLIRARTTNVLQLFLTKQRSLVLYCTLSTIPGMFYERNAIFMEKTNLRYTVSL